MSDDAGSNGGRDVNPLVGRVDALLKRAKPERAPGEVPVLTEVVADELARRQTGMDRPALEKLAQELERAVLERLNPQLERLIEDSLERTLRTVLAQSHEALRAELDLRVRQTVREAVAASIARALKAEPK